MPFRHSLNCPFGTMCIIGYKYKSEINLYEKRLCAFSCEKITNNHGLTWWGKGLQGIWAAKHPEKHLSLHSPDFDFWIFYWTKCSKGLSQKLVCLASSPGELSSHCHRGQRQPPKVDPVGSNGWNATISSQKSAFDDLTKEDPDPEINSHQFPALMFSL